MKILKLMVLSTFIHCGMTWAGNKSNYKDNKNVIWEKVLVVPTVFDKVQIDGTLNEVAWQSASFINTFYSSLNAKPLSIDVMTKVLFDGKNIIFGIEIPRINSGKSLNKCFLSDELDLRKDPNISIYLDPSHKHGVYYRFIVDPNGNKQDLRVDDESWRTDWTSEITKVDGVLQAEIKIPVSAITEKVLEGDTWGFNITLNGVNDKGLSATPIKYKFADAGYFGHLLFKGNMGKPQLLQIENSMPDFHILQDKVKLVANRVMCGPAFVDIDGEIEFAEVGIERTLKNGTKIKCIGLDNDQIIYSKYPFFYEKYENEQLQRLKRLYNLDEIATSGKNDFEKMLLVNKWLYEHVTFGSPPPIRPNALQILDLGLNGQTFNCTYLSFTLMQMVAALGYTARKITSAGHGTLDIWSDYWRKWIQLDPSRHSYFRMKGTGVPLNSNEIRREHLKNGGINMEMVFGTEQRAEQVTLETRDKDGLMRYRTDGYEWVAYKSRNNFFEIPFAYWNYDYLLIEDEFNADKLWKNGNITDMREILGTRTNRIGDVFWTLNQAHIHFYDQGTNQLKIQLETVTPNFKTFEYAVDHSEWQQVQSNFDWELHKGQNFLSTRSVNKFGIMGPEHKIVLKLN